MNIYCSLLLGPHLAGVHSFLAATQLRKSEHQEARAKWWMRIAGAVVLLCVQCCSALSSDASDSREELEKAIDGWKQIWTSMLPTTATATTVGEGEITDRNDPDFGKKNVIKYVYKFWLTDKSKKIVIDVFDEAGKWQKRRVTGSNPDYGFVAQQATENGPYYLTECVRDRQPFDHVNQVLSAFLIKLLAPISMGTEMEPLPEIVNRKGFRLIGTSKVEIDGHSYIQFQIAFEPGDVGPDDHKIPVSCRIVVDPAMNWRVVRTTTENDGQSVTMNVEYGRGDGANGLQKVTWDRKFSNAKNSETFEITSTLHEPPSDSEFYLASLGLPDCPTLGVTGNHRLLFIAINLLIIGVIFLILYRRRLAMARTSGSP